ncbi:DNA (cytosine-5)-methyltransferase-like protein 2 [Plasmodium ovale wallikeri]|uniref:DNA (Cytosine-5)-methyltransferase-like protein 2 n=1 Tax=Plasmodium ovale wallikeri TaxID=864142 RepID=A0A1A8YGY3_PLAOA|nr:DNA (cytosine-5)-methyltransferase-like protein 2 [Plasmodium ovale wallikeri]SBT31425.1 DNA (cytosine-5)-methyltransferase-like protein 2 [Plasmodium ovale wallikeri]
MDSVKVLELYSGIGGLHYSVLQTLINYAHKVSEKRDKGKCIKALNKIENIIHFISVDLNPIANETHYYNFKDKSVYLKNKKDIDIFFNKTCKNDHKKVHRKREDSPNSAVGYHSKTNGYDESKNYIVQTDINNLTVQFFEHHKFYLLLISNPCQPYTRLNKNFKGVDLAHICTEYNSRGRNESEQEGEKRQLIHSDEEGKNAPFEQNIQVSSNFPEGLNKDPHNNTYVDSGKENPLAVEPIMGYSCGEKKIDMEGKYDQIHATEAERAFCITNLDIEKVLGYLSKENDERTFSFIHVCNLLQRVDVGNLPEYIFIENVKNFEVSYSFLFFVNCIKKNYHFETYLLSPLQYGVPNERLRFYCICKKKREQNVTTFNTKEETQSVPFLYSNSLIPKRWLPLIKRDKNERKNEKAIFYTPSLVTFLDKDEAYYITCDKWKHVNMPNKDLCHFKVGNDVLLKRAAHCFDIIDVEKSGCTCCFSACDYYTARNLLMNGTHDKSSNRSSSSCHGNHNCHTACCKQTGINSERLHAMCFTSNYGRYINGSGSILYFSKSKSNIGENPCSNDEACSLPSETSVEDMLTKRECDKRGSKNKRQMKKYENKVRYFTPEEICRLMGYKMHTIREGLTESRKNMYGNIYWNVDHINHICAYTYNVNYCGGDSDNMCLHNCVISPIQPLTSKGCDCCGAKNIQKQDDYGRELYQVADVMKDSSDQMYKQSKVDRNMCMCHIFEFPEFLTNRQKHKLVGNSVNVTVISLLFQAHNILWDLIEGEKGFD